MSEDWRCTGCGASFTNEIQYAQAMVKEDG